MVKLNKSGNRRGRSLGETGLKAAELIHAAGDAGISTMEMRELLADRTTAARRTVMIAAQRGKFIKRSFKQLCVYYAPTVAPDTIERDFEQRKDDYLRAQVAIKAAANKRWYDAARHSAEVRKAARLDSKARRELAAQQRKATRAASATRRAEFDLTNRWAEKLRGTTCGIVQVPEKPAPTVDYSRAVITVAPRKLGRYEVADTIGPFSSTRPGQYVFPANGCAAKAAA